MTYTVQDGARSRGVKGIDSAMELAKQWSMDSGDVVSVKLGSTTYTFVHHGEEISGNMANRIWMEQEYATAQ